MFWQPFPEELLSQTSSKVVNPKQQWTDSLDLPAVAASQLSYKHHFEDQDIKSALWKKVVGNLKKFYESVATGYNDVERVLRVPQTAISMLQNLC